MHDDARSRLLDLAADPKLRTERARIRALRPEIEAARAAGRTWREIEDALGVARSTLFAALRGVRGKGAAPPANVDKVEKVAEVVAASFEEAQPLGEMVRKSKIKRWGE
jgi:hypothetical protein